MQCFLVVESPSMQLPGRHHCAAPDGAKLPILAVSAWILWPTNGNTGATCLCGSLIGMRWRAGCGGLVVCPASGASLGGAAGSRCRR